MVTIEQWFINPWSTKRIESENFNRTRTTKILLTETFFSRNKDT